MSSNYHTARPAMADPTRTSYPSEGFHIFLLFLIPLIWYRTSIQRERLAVVEEETRALEVNWQEAWRTKDWIALYGLLWFSLQQKSTHTPFLPKYYKMLLKCWHEEGRTAPRELLELGIIPLTINDGGLATEQVREWTVLDGFPWVGLPLYQQAKTRAFIEFLVPYPDDGPTREFLKRLENNLDDYGVLMRDNNAKKGSRRNRPIFADHHPLMMGAEAVVEAALPFMPDRKLTTHHKRVSHLEYFVKEGHVEDRLPLLQYTRWMLVRVEARHWGRLPGPSQLDRWVSRYAQSAGMERIWVPGVMTDAVEKELDRCGLGFDDF